MNVELRGADALDRQLAGLPATLRARLEAKARDLAAMLVDKVRNEKLSGSPLQAKSGALRDSIAAEVAADGDDIVATVGSYGDVRYAAIQEYGGRTPAHEILPDKARALAFMVGGAQRFARSVQHPGSQIPEHAYLRGSLEEARDDIVSAFAEAAQDAVEDA